LVHKSGISYAQVSIWGVSLAAENFGAALKYRLPNCRKKNDKCRLFYSHRSCMYVHKEMPRGRFLNRVQVASSKLEVNKFIEFATGQFSTWNQFKSRPQVC
jgi:hypothetical protein